MPVIVTITETTLETPRALPAGLFAFRVTNAGDQAHNLQIYGADTTTGFARDLEPGETRELLVDLAPGRYTIYCPLPGHNHQAVVLEVVPAKQIR